MRTSKMEITKDKRSNANVSVYGSNHIPHFSQFVGFQDSPNLSKIEKVAETCEFDGKEPLFVERTIAISNRVLG